MDRKKLRLTKEYFTDSLRVNLPIIAMSGTVTVACFLLFILQLSDAPVTETLQLSPSNPWGVFTSIFLHRSWEHLTANLAMLGVWNLYVVILPSLLSDGQKRGRASFFLPVVFGSAVLSQILWVVALNNANAGASFSSVGASGLVYSFSGAVLGFALTNATDAFTKYKTEANKKRARFVMAGNGLVVAMLLAIVLLIPDSFLSKGPGINAFVHGLAFVFGLFAVMAKENFLPTIRRILIRPTPKEGA